MGAGAILQGLVRAGTKARQGHVLGGQQAEQAALAKKQQEAEAEQALQNRLHQEALLQFQLDAPKRQREQFDHEQSIRQRDALAEIEARAKAERETNRLRPMDPKPPNPLQVAARSDALRNQFNQDPSYKNAVTIAEQYGNVQAASRVDTAAGDLKLIFSYMKMLDPGSTVREGEFANAQNAAGIPDQIRNLYNRAAKGTRLNPTQRADFLNQAKGTMDSQRNLLKGVKERYGSVASKRGIDPEEIVYDPFEVYDQPAEDPRIAEAVRRIRSGKATLEQAMASPALSPEVKAQIRQQLGGQ